MSITGAKLRFPLTALICVIGVVALLFPAPSAAQALYGSITGNISDPSGAPVPGARVSVKNLETNIVHSGATNDAGVYVVGDLRPGAYELTITAASFGSVTQTGIVVSANQVTRSDAALKVAGVSETATVREATQALQTDRGDVHSNLTTQQLTDLPITGSTGRNFEGLISGRFPPN